MNVQQVRVILADDHVMIRDALARLLGMDWMSRKICSVSATSVRYFLPSAAGSFSWLVALTN